MAGVSFTLAAGEAMGVLGLSGSGKTSLARGLCSIWPVMQGEVRLDGSELAHFEPIQLGRRIGYLPSGIALRVCGLLLPLKLTDFVSSWSGRKQLRLRPGSRAGSLNGPLRMRGRHREFRPVDPAD